MMYEQATPPTKDDDDAVIGGEIASFASARGSCDIR
jgi:hypothetical protein